MTKLEKAVRRAVRTPRAEYVVTLWPGHEPYIEIREKKRRTGFTAPVGVVYQMLATRAADAERERRRKARAERRGR